MDVTIPEETKNELRRSLKCGLAREALHQKILTEGQMDRFITRQGGPLRRKAPGRMKSEGR